MPVSCRVRGVVEAVVQRLSLLFMPSILGFARKCVHYDDGKVINASSLKLRVLMKAGMVLNCRIKKFQLVEIAKKTTIISSCQCWDSCS